MKECINFPKEKYDLIVIDPPWEMSKLTHKDRPRQIGFDYKTMTIDEIKEIDIPSISQDRCFCFLWTTQKYLFVAKEILESWGFKFLLTMVWKKTFGISSGMPLFGFRWNAEFILVGHKERIPLWVKGIPLIQVCFEAENVGHSKKPDIFYEMIKHLGNKRIDIFARKPRVGWDSYGDELEQQLKEAKGK